MANTATQSFRLAAVPGKVFSAAGAPGAAHPTAEALVVALNDVYQAMAGGVAGAAGLVRFADGRNFLVRDTGKGVIDSGDHVVKLVGFVHDPYLNGSDVVFGPTVL